MHSGTYGSNTITGLSLLYFPISVPVLILSFTFPIWWKWNEIWGKLIVNYGSFSPWVWSWISSVILCLVPRIRRIYQFSVIYDGPRPHQLLSSSIFLDNAAEDAGRKLVRMRGESVCGYVQGLTLRRVYRLNARLLYYPRYLTAVLQHEHDRRLYCAIRTE